MSTADFYLGAGSPGGFVGYFSRLCDVNSKFTTTLIKAGPGCGKSSLMKKLSDHLGDKSLVERIHCSSDPNSLDGVICHDMQFAIIDATAPHVVEPNYPIAVEKILSLFHLLNDKHLSDNRAAIIEHFDKNRCYHERASRYITSAGSLLQDSMRVFGFCTNMSKLEAFCKRLCAKKLKQNHDTSGIEHKRLLSAVTPNGVIFYGETIKQMAKNIVVVEDEIGLISKHIMAHIKNDALSKGYEIFSCYCPMFPHEKIDHIIIPSLSLAFVTANRYLDFDYGEAEIIKHSRFILPERVKERKRRLKFNRTITADLLSQAVIMLKKAKAEHDLLEKYYIEAMDFSGVNKLYEKVKAEFYL